MRNITVSVDEETHRIARIKAAEAGISMSALVRDYFRSLAWDDNRETPSERLLRTLDEVHESLRARGSKFSAADRLPREELHDRDARRREHEESLKRDALR